jgi:hypothetical protein
MPASITAITAIAAISVTTLPAEHNVAGPIP